MTPILYRSSAAPGSAAALRLARVGRAGYFPRRYREIYRVHFPLYLQNPF